MTGNDNLKSETIHGNENITKHADDRDEEKAEKEDKPKRRSSKKE